jgi:membrane protease subunit HflK
MLDKFKDEKQFVFRDLDRILAGGFVFMLLLCLSSAIYVIEANEVGLLCRFGELRKGTLQPGIHYRIPWPVDHVYKVKIKEVKRIEVGFSAEQATRGSPLFPYCITGDSNIIHSEFVIQYRISDPAGFLFRSIRPERLLEQMTESSIILTLAHRDVDPVLTTGKREVELEILEHLQAALDQEQLGISISSIETKQVEPPDAVRHAFKDVVNAREERATLIHDAWNYSNKVIPEARAQADRILEEAEAYRFQRVSAAEGESSRFLKIYEQYRSAPEVIRTRMRLQIADEVLPNVRLYVVATDAKGKPVGLNLIRGALPTHPRLPR